MKKIFLIPAFLLVFLALPGESLALEDRGGFVIENYEVEIKIEKNGDLKVEEEIGVNFLEDRHGIFREIPYRYKNDQGFEYNLDLKNFDVSSKNGQSIPFERKKEAGNVVLKIGDPDKEVRGRHNYRIDYSVESGIRYFEDHDELYWNAVGTEWPTIVKKAKSKVIFPAHFDVAKEDLNCFTGEKGSKESDCSAEKIKTKDVVGGVEFVSDKQLKANEGMTVAVKFPKGFIEEPTKEEKAGKLFSDNWGFLIPIPVFLLMLFLWINKGREINLNKTTIAQYEIPDNLTPGEVGYLLKEKYSSSFVSADMVNLAVKGYLKIKEIERSGFSKLTQKFLKKAPPYLVILMIIGGGIGFATKNDVLILAFLFPGFMGAIIISIIASKIRNRSSGKYKLIKKRDWENETVLVEHEKKLLDGLFTKTGKDEIALEELEEFHSDVKISRNALKKQVKDREYFYQDFWRSKGVYFVFAFSLAFLAVFGAATSSRLDLFVGGFASALVVAGFGMFMSKKTKKGAEAVWKIQGFKEYIKTAERYRVKFQEKENLFEKYLPYAMVFGLADKWAKAFEGIYEKNPEWYESSQPGAFHAGYLAGSLGNFADSANVAYNPPRSSSSSGFGGGGSAGGGSGGGGGGSW
ncbi:MAG: DUF2207 domain-containing protein [Candidatus Moraniibacteriota bacterium]